MQYQPDRFVVGITWNDANKARVLPSLCHAGPAASIKSPPLSLFRFSLKPWKQGISKSSHCILLLIIPCRFSKHKHNTTPPAQITWPLFTAEVIVLMQLAFSSVGRQANWFFSTQASSDSWLPMSIQCSMKGKCLLFALSFLSASFL